MKNRWLAVPIVVGVLAGCAPATTGKGASVEPTGTNRPATPSVSSPTSEPTGYEETTPEPEPSQVKFGQSFSWNDGLSVNVSAPKAFKPGSNAAVMAPQKYAVIMTVTIVNKTGKVYDPTLFSTTMQSANTEVSEIIDIEAKIEGSPNTKIINGREVKFKVAYSVPNPKDLVMEVAPGFDYESALFTTK